MSRTSTTQGDLSIRCTCGKVVAKHDGIKCRCGEVVPIHFYPGKAIGGGSIEQDWQQHWNEAANGRGCEICGIPARGARIPSAADCYPAGAIGFGGSGPMVRPGCEHHLSNDPRTLGGDVPVTTPATVLVVTPEPPTGSHALAANYVPVPVSLDTKGTDYKLPDFGQVDPNWLSGARVLVISADGPELPELAVPMTYLRDRGAKVTLAGQDWIFQWRNPAGHIVVAEWLSDNVCVKADIRMSDVNLDDYDAVFIPGGAWNPDMLRTDDVALKLVRDAHEKKLLIVSLCHGPQVLISAAFDAPQGQKNFPASGVHITGTSSIRRDLKNAGFIVHTDKPVVYDEKAKLLTSRDPNDLGEMCNYFGSLLAERMETFRLMA